MKGIHLPAHVKPPSAALATHANSLAVLGLQFRFARREAERLGVPVFALGDGKRKKLAIPVEQFLAALGRSEQYAPKPIEELDDASQRAAMLDSLGLQAGGHR